MIGIIGAMSIEVVGLIDSMLGVNEVQVGGINFWHGKIFETEVVLAKSGVGKVSAGVTAQAMIQRFAPELVLNTGVAGAISLDVEVGDVVVGSSVVQHDIDTSLLGDPLGFISGLGLVFLKCSEAHNSVLLKLAQREAGLNGNKAVCGIIATGDKFVSKEEDGRRISQEFKAVAAEMEGGAVGQSCAINQVEFCVVRAVSDSIYGKSHQSYNEFAKQAAEQSIRIVKDFCNGFGKQIEVNSID